MNFSKWKQRFLNKLKKAFKATKNNNDDEHEFTADYYYFETNKANNENY